MSQQHPPPTRERGNPRLGDMVRSVVVLGLIVGGLLIFTALLRTEPQDPATKSVEYQMIAEQAQEAVSFELLVPDPLPDGANATSARIDRDTVPIWHVGVLTDARDYIGLEQGELGIDRAIETFAPETSPAEDPEVEVAGQTWQVRTDGDSETTYVRRDAGVTVLVTGDAPADEIEDFIASLTPVAG